MSGDVDYPLKAELDNELVLKRLEEMDKAADKMAQSANESMKVLGQAVQSVTNELRDAVDAGKETGRVYASIFGESGKTFKQTAAEVQRLKTAVNELTKGLSETAKTDKIKEALNVQDANVRLQQLKGTIDTLFDSGNQEAVTFANSLKVASTNASQLFAAGKISSTQFNKELATLNATANRTARGLGVDLSDGADKAHVSLWKLSNVFDRVGVQGVGNTFRVVDALRGIHPAVVLGAVGVAGLVIVFNKLAQAAIQVADRVKDMFLEILKGSLTTSEGFEILERQFGNIFKGNVQAAEAVFKRIKELSVQYGVDLTGDFSKILLPELGSIEELERAARIASTLAIGFGRTQEEVARAFKQGQAGLFRSLQEQFGLLGSDIERIKELQDSLGATEGLIQGIEEFLDRTGQGWDTYEGTLRRVRGSLEAVRKLAEDSLGAPARDELTEQLQGVLDFIDRNRREIEAVAFAVGDVVANALSQLGGIGKSLLGDVDLDAILAVLDQAEATAQQILGLGSDIIGETETSGLVGAMLATLEIAEDITLEIRNWVAFIQFYLGFLGDVNDIMDIISEKTGISRDIGTGSPLGLARLEEIEAERRALEQMQEARRRAIEAILAGTDASLDAADALMAESQALNEYNRLMIEAAEATDKFMEAREELTLEGEARMTDFLIEEERKRLDLELEFSRERAKIWQDLLDELTKSWIKFVDDVEDRQIELGRKLEDVDIEYGRKIADIDEGNAKERLEIENDFQRKLIDIRKRFDFDATEAIRRNDAVALLRIRRRMQFELDNAKQDRDRDVEDAEASAKERREELAKWLQREREDAELWSKRKQEDLELAFKRRNESLVEQYKRELREQQLSEKIRTDDFLKWRARELADLNRWWDQKIKLLMLRYKQELEIVRRFEEAKRNLINMGLLPPGSTGTGGTGTGTGSFPGSGGYPGGGVSGTWTLDQLRAVARNLAQQLGNTELISVINQMSANDLRRLILELQAQLAGGAAPISNAPGNFLPGSVGNTQAVTSVPSPAIMGAVTHNKTNHINMSMLDPSQLSPIQIAMIRQIATEQILKSVI